MDFRFRAQWGATFDVSNMLVKELPLALVFIHHNVMAPSIYPNIDMERTEQIDISRFGTPSYNWAIHPSGVVLEGTTKHVSPDTINHNADSFSIMFMGNFENDQPTKAAMLACRELIQALRVYKMIVINFKLLGHRDVFATACPGANLYPRLGELLVPPPVTLFSPIKAIRKDNMVLQDPTTGGYWVAYDSGAVNDYDGAPHLGGTNNAKMNSLKFPCVGIARYTDAHGEGFTLILDFGLQGNSGDRFRRYRFPRDGSARVE